MESAFQFTNPVLLGLEFYVNEDFKGEKDKEVQITMGISVNVSRKDDSNEAVVKLDAVIGEKSINVPFWVKATEEANFRWNEEIEDNMIERLLNQNAPSLLLSYLRPIISQVTSSSKFGAYNIPFINFTKNSN